MEEFVRVSKPRDNCPVANFVDSPRDHFCESSYDRPRLRTLAHTNSNLTNTNQRKHAKSGVCIDPPAVSPRLMGSKHDRPHERPPLSCQKWPTEKHQHKKSQNTCQNRFARHKHRALPCGQQKHSAPRNRKKVWRLPELQ